MKLDLRENMYIRTKDGIIAKVDYIDDNTIFFDKDLYRTYDDGIDFLEKDNLERIIKASYNIIDVLEVGDYVNGQIVTQIIPNNRKKEPSTMIYTGINYYVGLYDENIKSIVTKESMESVTYYVK